MCVHPRTAFSSGNVGHQRGLRRCGGRPQQYRGAAGAGDAQVPCTLEGRVGEGIGAADLGKNDTMITTLISRIAILRKVVYMMIYIYNDI